MPSSIRILAAAVVLLLVPASSRAENYPNPGRLIRFIVPFTPGVGADIVARLFGPRIAERWHANVVTENRIGASGNLGADLVAKSPPDGYTFLFTATSFGTNPALLKNLPFDPVSSFEPVSVVATSVLSFLVAPQIPATTIREFIALAQRERGALNYGSGGNGTPQHLTMELFKIATGLELVHVPYKGSGGALPDLMAGHVQAMIAPLQTAAPFVTGGNVKMLAVFSEERAPAFPNVPTLREEGLPDLEVATWYGVFAPAGTPADIVLKLNTEIDSLLSDPEIRDHFARQGMLPAGGPPDRMAALLKDELARWSRVVAAAHLHAD